MPDHKTPKHIDTASKSGPHNYATNGVFYFNPATPVYYAYYINEVAGTPTISMLHNFLMRTIPNSVE